MSRVPPLSEADFLLFQEYFESETGLFFENHQDHLLLSALAERMARKGHSSHKEYYNYLKYHPEARLELREILTLLTTGETYFFRNIAQFEVLMQDVLPEIIKRKRASGDRSLRVWSAGCSRGDEAYSVAIAIMEVLADFRDWDISILGSDINRDVLAVAREAVYTPKDLGELPAEYVEKFFHRKKSEYVLNADVKALGRFNFHNLCKDSFGQEGMTGLDIIFCRNVTIYFNPETTRKLMGRFYESLADGGYMFLGHSETLWQINHHFRTIEYPHTFIYKKELGVVPMVQEARAVVPLPVFKFGDDQPAFTIASEPGAVPPAGEAFFSDPETDGLLTEATRAYQKKKYDVALTALDKIVARHDTHARAHFLKSVILADQEKYEEAASLLVGVVQKDSLNEEAAFLLATLFAKMGKVTEAETYFRRIVYLSADEPLTYFHLGNIYAAQKKPAKAELEFKNAIRLLEKRTADEPVRFSEDFSSGLLLQACKHNLATLLRGGAAF
ncbi:MAG: tetratricopeptide repeat protein [Candidatus Omnitrophica bacterium]|nr:tetratricopeptide repeat protein [Candidatus Omnitrophota bacterium]